MKFEAPKNTAQLGVEISDLDLTNKFTEEEISIIRKQWLDYGVAVFPNQKLAHADFEQFSLLFGKFGDDPYLKSLDERPNIVEVKRSACEKAPPFGGSWHSDWSFQKTPPSATLLHSKVIPPVGGDTLFANTQLAYEDLDEDMKDKIKDLQVIHSASLPYADDGFYATEKEIRTMDILPSKKAKATQLHPLVKTHAETNKKCLFINPVYTVDLLDSNNESVGCKIDDLIRKITMTEHQFKLSWDAGYLVIWDNRRVIHKAEGGYDGYDRILLRVTIGSELPK